MSKLYLLFEAASGYAIFRVVEAEDVAAGVSAVQSSWADFHRFSNIVKLRVFEPFLSADHALEEVTAVSENRVTPFLTEFLQGYFGSKKGLLGVSEPRFGAALQEQLGKKRLRVVADEHTQELVRNIRQHFEKFLGAEIPANELFRAQLGLAHAFSRTRIRFNPHRNDTSIVQAIHLIDQLDKDINMFGMRVREWYSWHFPELVKIVNDNVLYCRLVCAIGIRSETSTALQDEVTRILSGDTEMAERVLRAARSSMGTELSPMDMIQIRLFAQRVMQMATYREHLQSYLGQRLSLIAPSLRALLGDHIAARLIAHAGSLVNLAKYPASTVQILGAEKALFRALKQARGNRMARTPKYGLLFNSTFIAKAKQRAKGRISRYLANKVSLASRIDCFRSDQLGDVFGRKMREQVEERLEFYEAGARPRRNVTVMVEALQEALASAQTEASLEGMNDPTGVALAIPSQSEHRKMKDSRRAGEEPPAVSNSSALVLDQKADTATLTEKRHREKKRNQAALDELEKSAVAEAHQEASVSSSKKKRKHRQEASEGTDTVSVP
jgi:nucleolar protein 56